MALQSDDLTALGLGITADQPPISLQPVLGNGIHLRYATSFDKGLPWYGFYLFRRQHVAAITQCLAPQLARLTPHLTSATAYAFSGVSLYSGVPIDFIDEFPAPGAAEVALPATTILGANFAPGPVHRVTAKIGFRESKPQGERICDLIQFYSGRDGKVPNPLLEKGATFRGGNVRGTKTPSPMRYGQIGFLNALIISPQGDDPATLEITLPAPSEPVILGLSHPSGTLSVQGWDSSGKEIKAARQTAAANSFSLVTLSQAGLARIRLTCAGGELGVHFLFFCSSARPPGPRRAVRMVAKDADVIVAEATISGQPGDVVAGEVNADRITSVEFHPAAVSPPSAKAGAKNSPAPSAPPQPSTADTAPAALPIALPDARGSYAVLVDLCWDTVANALHGRWQRVANFPYPMGLPVAEASYPCAGKPASQAAAESVALSRVRYGSSSNWGGAKFAELHAILTKLVAGGPSGALMRDRTDTFVDTSADPDTTPQLPDQNLLQLVQLASIDPAMAQIFGLYWLDGQVVPGQAYDYIVLADHQNAFAGNAGAALAAANGNLPASVDAWITFNHVAKPRPPLTAPAGPTALVLPDAAVDGLVGTGRGAVGLRWDPPALGSDYLSSDAAVRYIAWRHDYGDAEPPMPASAFVPLNQDAPYLVGDTTSASTANAPTNWPPFVLHAVDRQLADGWYGYRISGIDIWGRYSGLSQPAQWRQWAPAPQPEPWYYQNPPADKQLHVFAVHILDKTPPPPPAAVEATALDPDDDVTYVRDAAYTAWSTLAGAPWWTGLSDAQRASVLPLRVRWRWYPAQQDQHPNTREFRVYFNPNSVAPGPDRFDSVNWQERIFVCGYNQYVTLVPPGTGEGPYRQYEVLLPVAPPPGSPPFHGVSMQPSLAQPIVYANISVSAADDKTHTDDNAKWNATPWGGRYGNEGVLAAAAKIYRVWRALPPAPLSLIDDERVWATTADYQSHSFRTFRWPASADLKAHVYSVLDGTLFMVERAREDIAAVSAADMAALQAIWNPVPQSLIDQIAALRALKAAVSNTGTPATDEALRKQHDAAWDAACTALSDSALRGLAALPLHEDSFVRLTTSPVDDLDFVGPDDPSGYAPNALWRAYEAMFDGRARNRYFLRASYIDGAHNEGPLGPPSPPIYLPPVVPPPTPVIVKVTGGDRSATVSWTTANADAGGTYILYRTDDDYRLRDVRLMDQAATIASADLDPNAAKAEWTDASGLEGGKTYYYCLAFIDADGNASTPSKPVPVNVVDLTVPSPPSWTEQTWLLERASDNALIDWPADGLVPAGHAPVLRLSWVTDVKQPVFVLTRRQRYGRVWSAPSGTDQIVASTSNAGEYSWIDRAADPAKLWEYRNKLRAPTGVWSTEYNVLSAGRPVMAEAG
jgi:hypothetical protein